MKQSPFAVSAIGEQFESGRDRFLPVRGRQELRDGSLEHLFEHGRVRPLAAPSTYSLIYASAGGDIELVKSQETVTAKLVPGECVLIPPNAANKVQVGQDVPGTYLFEIPAGLINRFLQPVVMCRIWHPIQDPHLSSIAEWLIASTGLHTTPFEEYRNALFHALAARLAALMSVEGDALTTMGSRNREVMDRVMEIFRADPKHEMTVDEIASEVGLSGSQLNRIFQRAIGQPVHRYRMDMRLDNANRVIRSSELPLARIAFDCGFNDAAHLCKCYKNRFGVSPGAVRRHLRNSG